MEYTLCIYYSRYTEYRQLNSLWAANLISINLMRTDARIEEIQIVNNKTAEIEKSFVR